MTGNLKRVVLILLDVILIDFLFETFFTTIFPSPLDYSCLAIVFIMNVLLMVGETKKSTVIIFLSTISVLLLKILFLYVAEPGFLIKDYVSKFIFADIPILFVLTVTGSILLIRLGFKPHFNFKISIIPVCVLITGIVVYILFTIFGAHVHSFFWYPYLFCFLAYALIFMPVVILCSNSAGGRI